MRRAHVRTDDPSDDTPRPKKPRGVPRPLAMSEVQRIYDATNRQRTRAYVALAVLAGLRVHEIAKFRAEDLSIASDAITVTGKGGVTQIIPLHPDLAALAPHMPASGWWFPAYGRPGPVTRAAVYAAITSATNRAGIHATPHQLRHAYGTELLRRGANIRTVQELLRHASIETTQRYTDTDWTEKRAAIHTLRIDSGQP
jgi:site-specific recombinase XerD